MGKNLDKLGSLDDFTAPWETATGETEIDKSKLKKFLFGLLSDKAKAQDARDDTAEKLKTTETERDEAKTLVENRADPDLAKELEKSRGETAKEKERADKAERSNLVTRIATERGIPLSQAQRLQGNTEDELSADADAFLKDFTPATPREEPGDEGGGDDNPLQSAPQRRGRNLGETPGVGASKNVDFEQAALAIKGKRLF